MRNSREQPSSEEMLRKAKEEATTPDFGSEPGDVKKPLSSSEIAARLHDREGSEEKLRNELADAASAETHAPEQEGAPDSSVPATKEPLREYPLDYSEDRWPWWKRLLGGDPDTEERARLKGEAPFGRDGWGVPKKSADDGIGTSIRKMFGLKYKGRS